MSEVDATLRRIANAKKIAESKIKNGKTEEEREDGKDLQYYIDKLIQLMCEYTEKVFIDNKKNYMRTQLVKSMDRSEYQFYCENIEKDRKTCHDALITQVKITDSLCEELKIEPIYGRIPKQFRDDTSKLMGSQNRNNPGVTETRHAIANWAWDVSINSTVALIMDISELDYDTQISDLEKISSAFNKMGGKSKASKMINEMTEPER